MNTNQEIKADPTPIFLAKLMLIIHLVLLFIITLSHYMVTINLSTLYVSHGLICILLIRKLSSKKSLFYYFGTIYPIGYAIYTYIKFNTAQDKFDLLSIFIYSYWGMIISLILVSLLLVSQKKHYPIPFNVNKLLKRGY